MSLLHNVVSCVGRPSFPNLVLEWCWIREMMNVVTWFSKPKSLFLIHESYVNMWSLDLVGLGTLVMYVNEWKNESLVSVYLEWCPSMKYVYGNLNMKRRLRVSYLNKPWVAAQVDPFLVGVLWVGRNKK